MSLFFCEDILVERTERKVSKREIERGVEEEEEGCGERMPKGMGKKRKEKAGGRGTSVTFFYKHKQGNKV